MNQHPDNIVRDNRGKMPRYVLERTGKGVWVLRDQVNRRCVKTWSFKPSDEQLRAAFTHKHVRVIHD